MAQSLTFLPSFNAQRVERYFCNDPEAIREMFKVTAAHLGHDLDKLFTAMQQNDITGIQTATHTILPIFNIIGLPSIEKEVISFHAMCIKADSAETLKIAFTALWPQLENAKKMIVEQSLLFENQAIK
jgi:hypothetical protein